MPQDNDASQRLLPSPTPPRRDTEALNGTTKPEEGFFERAWKGFCAFALRENVLEVALGLIIAKAFSKVVTSLVSDILLPVVSLLPFLNRNLHEMFAVPRGGPHQKEGYNTVEQAQGDGALVLAYGAFADSIINFFGIGLSLYLIAQTYAFFSKDSMIKLTKKCEYCVKSMPDPADRCFNCTSWVGEKRLPPPDRSA